MFLRPGRLIYILACIAACATSSEPAPDTSEECLSCQSQVQALQDTWTNETTVQSILEDMQENCEEYPFMQRQLCDKIAEVLVQIPPALFEGMEDLAWPIPLAMCATVQKCKVECCGADSPPEQVHLSLASKDHSIMGVTWTTLNQTHSIAQYGLAPDSFTMEVSGTMDTYTAAGWVGTLHRAAMVGLAASTTYYYRVGDGSSWSETFSFTTPPSTPSTITYAVIADMAYDESSDATVANVLSLVEQGVVQAVIHSGDISYADGYEPHWDDFFNKIEPIAAHVPYMMTPGNHEFWYNFTSYKHRVYMPGVLDNGGSGDNMYYSYDIGHTHFVAMNSESPIDTPQFSDAEMAWLDADLAAVDRSVTPWIVAHFHRPMYCTNDNDCDKAATSLKDKAEEIFYARGVDVVITGHVHGYQRTYPMYQEVSTAHDYTAPTAPVYLLQGASGNREGNKGSYPPPEEMPEWVAASHTDVGFALMTISADSLEWVFYAADAANGPKELDRVTITH